MSDYKLESMSKETIGTTLMKLFFPLLLLVMGLVMIVVSLVKEPIAGETQSDWFFYGALTVFTIGVVSILYMLELVNKIVHLSVTIILSVVCAFLAYMSFQSVEETMILRDEKTKKEKWVIQGLSDIRDIQVAYKKTYGVYAPDFAELKRFLLNDLTYRTVRNGEIPDRKPTPEEALKLGYDLIKDESKILDGFDESEALALGYLDIDTIWFPVIENLFTGEDAKKRKRRFDFSIDEFQYVPLTNKEVLFSMTIVNPDSVTSYFMALDPKPYDPFKKDHQPRDTLKVGSLTENSTSGSWGE